MSRRSPPATYRCLVFVKTRTPIGELVGIRRAIKMMMIPQTSSINAAMRGRRLFKMKLAFDIFEKKILEGANFLLLANSALNFLLLANSVFWKEVSFPGLENQKSLLIFMLRNKFI